MEYKKTKVKCELYHDSFQNFKKYGIPKAQLVIADIPYNLGTNAYGSSPEVCTEISCTKIQTDRQDLKGTESCVQQGVLEVAVYSAASALILKRVKDDLYG